MDKKQLIILIVVGVVLFLLGLGLGILSTKIGVAQTKINTANSLSSKVVTTIAASGKVTKIEGRNITLNKSDDNLVISIADNAHVYSLVASKTGNVQQTVTFGDIKVGDNVNVIFKLSPEGQLQGATVVIFPVVAAPAAK